MCFLFLFIFCFFFTFKPPCAFYCVHFCLRWKLSILRSSTGARTVTFLCVQWSTEIRLENSVHSFRALRYLHGLFLCVFYFYYYFVPFSLLNPHVLFTVAYIFLFAESSPSYGLWSMLGPSLFFVSSGRRKLASRIPSILSAHYDTFMDAFWTALSDS
jgi:succinate dehydrogenase/fumarate reductase cytochrome b subunit